MSCGRLLTLLTLTCLSCRSTREAAKPTGTLLPASVERVVLGGTPQAIMVAGILPQLLPDIGPIRLRDYYMWTYVRPMIAAVPFAITCWAIDRLLAPRDLVTFMVAGGLSLVTYVVPIAALAMTAEERAYGASVLRIGRRARTAPAAS